jgi:ABC-type transport system involved in cytochrome c biogenesis permease subunit
MDSVLFFYLTAIGYFISFVFYLLHLIGEPKGAVKTMSMGLGITATASVPWILKQTTWGTLATWSTAVTVIFGTVAMVLRTIELAHVSEYWTLPVTNTYETLVFFSWAIPLVYLFLERRYKIKVIGVMATGLAFIAVALASSPLISAEVRPLVPALQSYWLKLHVLFTLGGEAFFAIAFGASLLFLILQRRASVETLKLLDNVSYKSIAIGFPLFTLGGIVFGAVWAQHAWGRYWGWDPKETWMLISWFIYALYLHVRVKWGWRDAKTAWLAVLGFIVCMFTWWGVNFLLSGLHSYG